MSTATDFSSDSTTQGSWLGTYGASGYIFSPTPTYHSLPASLTVTPNWADEATWAASTANLNALETPDGTSRVAATWYSAYSPPNDHLDLLIAGATDPYRLSIYLLDYSGGPRAETLTIHDAGTLEVLDTKEVAAFDGGLWLSWTITGDVLVRAQPTAGPNGVISGLFFDPVGPPAPTAYLASFGHSFTSLA